MAKKKNPDNAKNPPDEAAVKNNDAASSRKFTLKDLAIAFLIFFVIFGFIGYLRGRSLRSQPDRLRWEIMPRLKLAENRQEKKVLVYQCADNGDLAQWNIDDNILNTEVIAGKPDEEFTFSPSILKNETLTTAFLAGGGAASIFTVREVFNYATASSGSAKLANENHIKLIAAAALGTVIGYEIGYQIALSEELGCKDPRLSDVLNNNVSWTGDGAKWEGFEKIYWLAYLKELRKNQPDFKCGISDPQIKNEQEAKIKAATVEFLNIREGEATRLGHNISLADFNALGKYEAALDEFGRNCR